MPTSFVILFFYVIKLIGAYETNGEKNGGKQIIFYPLRTPGLSYLKQ